MPRTDADLDEMIADFKKRFGSRNDVLLGVTKEPEPEPETVQERAARGEPDAVRRMRALDELGAPPDYGPEPRKDWPKLSRDWTPELVTERRHWVRHFVEGEDLTYGAAAARIGVSEHTVQLDASHLGINRGVRNYGKGGVKQVRVQERREQLKVLFEQNLSSEEIAEQLGVHTTTILKDIQALGLKRPRQTIVNNKAVTMISNALTAMDDMAQLLLNLPELEILQVNEEQAKAWLKQLRRIARASSRVRKSTKGTQP